MATRKNTRIANVIANEVKGDKKMSNKKNSTKKSVNATANVKGDVAMAIAKEIVKKNIANATMKGETAMTMTANINTNTKLNGYEIRFSVAPSEEFRKMLGRAEKGEDKRKKHYNFRYYSHLNNAWVIKQDKITENSFKTLKSKIAKLGYVITETTDGESPKARKGRKPVVEQPTPKQTEKAVKDTTLEVKTTTIPKEADLITYLTSLGYVIELPEQKAEPKKESKPKAKKSTTASKPKNRKSTTASSKTKSKKANKEIVIEGMELFCDEPTSEEIEVL